MHPPRFTIGSLALLVEALGVAFAALKGNHVWSIGLTMMTIIALLGAAIGASADVGRPSSSSSGSSSAVPRL